jgi:hypothetical protein
VKKSFVNCGLVFHRRRVCLERWHISYGDTLDQCFAYCVSNFRIIKKGGCFLQENVYMIVTFNAPFWSSGLGWTDGLTVGSYVRVYTWYL